MAPLCQRFCIIRQWTFSGAFAPKRKKRVVITADFNQIMLFAGGASRHVVTIAAAGCTQTVALFGKSPRLPAVIALGSCNLDHCNVASPSWCLLPYTLLGADSAGKGAITGRDSHATRLHAIGDLQERVGATGRDSPNTSGDGGEQSRCLIRVLIRWRRRLATCSQ